MDVKKFVRDQGYTKDVPGGFYATVDLVEAAIAQDRKEREVSAIETDEQHERYLAEAKELMDVTDADSPRAKRLKLLASLIENYEYHKYPELRPDPLAAKLERLNTNRDGWTWEPLGGLYLVPKEERPGEGHDTPL
ncbi:MAG: hypothetical protein ACYTEQ_25365 [Planctomycetota bacterium]|jgi:hypothetical protein